MAEPKTDLNESLCCIALRYIQQHQNDDVTEFKKMILNPTDNIQKKKFKDCIDDNLEVGTGNLKRHITYKSAYQNYHNWIEGSFYSAQAIKTKLNIDISDYIISRPDKTESNNRAFTIKEKCTTAIKTWAEVYEKSNTDGNWKRGILSSLKSDKINIADIMLIKKTSDIYKNLDEMQKITNQVKWSEVQKTPSLITKLLTPKKYVEYMNLAWKTKEIINISLKQVLTTNVPLKIINYDPQSANEYDNDIDEFKFLISSLIGAAKSKSLSDFETLINKTIDLEPVIFTSNDRLEVKYKLNIKNLNLNNVKSYDYTMWTNFGGGTNSVYFSQSGSGSASGEGGITLSHFTNLVHDIPQLKKFIIDVKEKRKYYFDQACKNNGIEFNHAMLIHRKLGNTSLSSPKYDTMLYTSNDFKKLVHVLLTDTSYEKMDDVITPVKYQANLKEIVIDDLIGTVGKAEKKRNIIKQISISLQNKSLERIKCLEEFFSSYINFLSNNNHSMGTYFGVSESYKRAVESTANRVQEAYTKKYNDLILDRLVTKIAKEQEKKNKIDRNMLFFTKQGKISEQKIKQELKNNQQLSAIYEEKFKLLDREMKKFASEALKYGQSENKHIEPSFKKSFALLANAEFGYMYSEHAQEITEMVKKQVLLSLYAAASGRGYIIFDGKRFATDDYFEKDVKGAPFLKVGM